jgi:hypothetical protein
MLNRGDKVFLNHLGNQQYEVTNNRGEVVYGDDYFFYFKNANLKPNGSIEGRFLGEGTETLEKMNVGKAIYHEGEGFKLGRKRVRTARMIVAKSDGPPLVIIE